MPHALIENGVVVQLWLPENPPEGYIECGLEVQPGYSFDGESFSPPPPTQQEDPLTKPLPRLDFWLVAASAGVSKWSVRDRIAAMPEATTEEFLVKAEVIAWFEEASQYRRYDPVLVTMAEAEGINSDQLDALWVWALGP
jgi:hypothetical protein